LKHYDYFEPLGINLEGLNGLLRQDLLFKSILTVCVIHTAIAYTRLLNKPYENEVTLREQIPPLECCHPPKLFLFFEKRFRSFNTGNMESVRQRAAKLLSIKL